MIDAITITESHLLRAALDAAEANRDAKIEAARQEYEQVAEAVRLVSEATGALPRFRAQPANPSGSGQNVRRENPSDGSKTPSDRRLGGFNALAEFRRIIGEVPEPFSKNDVRREAQQQFPDLDAYYLGTPLHTSFTHLERQEYITRDSSGESRAKFETLYRRGPRYSSQPTASRNSIGVMEPSTGHKWPSVMHFVRDNPSLTPSAVYRALRTGEPLPGGRAICRASECDSPEASHHEPAKAKSKGVPKKGKPFRQQQKRSVAHRSVRQKA